jgi:hypothetical protein
MSHRKHRSPSEWRALIEEQLSSDMTGVAFCNERGLSAKTFYKQRKRLGYSGRTSGPANAGGFVRVQPEASAVSSRPLTLYYRDSRLELSPETSTHWVAELLRALA